MSSASPPRAALGMRIAVLAEWHSEEMGYISNGLPKALASLGHEVYLLAPNVQPYYSSKDFRDTYQDFLGPPVVPCEEKDVDGYRLIRLPFIDVRGRLGMRGLVKKLRALSPHVVQNLHHASLSGLQAAASTRHGGYRLFTGSHIHRSAFPLAQRPLNPREHVTKALATWLPGRLVSMQSEKCYVPAPDAADIASNFFGVQRRKISVMPLGVDTDLFHPIDTPEEKEERRRIRHEIGVDGDVLCIYTGRLSEGKNPLLLAEAIAYLRGTGKNFAGLFIGRGPQLPDISRRDGCVTRPFVSFRDLAPLYRAADVAVWPRQETTSMLDAAACGLPIVISDRAMAKERVTDNGLSYRHDDLASLVSTLHRLQSSQLRHELGRNGARRVASQFAWTVLAARRVADYEVAISR